MDAMRSRIPVIPVKLKSKERRREVNRNKDFTANILQLRKALNRNFSMLVSNGNKIPS